jgi:anaerobic ribonucleoside-triphosphate reductase activating protein
MIWQLNKIQYPIYNLGPGKRLGIWVQGCSIHCKACISKSTWNRENGKQVALLSVYELVNHICNDYDGITITGGEPFDQYPQLMVFASMIMRKTGLNILCYTGYYLQELEMKFPDKAFYSCIDFLVDGRFEKDNPSDNSLKGSDNQTIYKFVGGKAEKSALFNESKIWSVNSDENIVYMAGIPAKNQMDELIDKLYKDNIKATLN